MLHGVQRRSGQPPLPLPLRMALFAGAYFACAKAGGHLSPPDTTYVSFWLPAGLFVAALLLSPQREWPWFVLGACAANFSFDYLHGTRPVTMVWLFCAANALQAVLGAWLMRRFISPQPSLATLKEFAGLIGIAGVGSTMVGALAGATTLVLFGISSSWQRSWEVWWGSCAMPVLVLAPFIVVWFSGDALLRARSIPAKRIPEAVLVLCLLIFAVWFLMTMKGGIMSPLKTWLIPILLYAGIRFGVHGATAAALVTSLLMAYLNAKSPPPIPVSDYVFVLQSALATASLVGMVPAIVLGERDQTLARLRESEAHFRQLNEAAFEGIGISENGRVVDANDQLLRMLGYTREEFVGKPVLDLVAPETREVVAEAIRSGEESDYQHRLLRKDGRSFIAEARVKLVEIGGRRFRMTAVRDVTERRQAELALRRSEELFRAIVEDQTEMIVRWKPDGTRTFVNAAYCRVFGGTREQFAGTSFFPLIAEADREAVRARIRALTPENPVTTAIHRSVAPNGDVLWQEWTDRAIFDERGQVVELQSTGRDITARRQAEASLRQAQENELRVQEEFSRRLIAAQEEERRRLASELHDSLGQNLSIIKNRAHLAAQDPAIPPEATHHLEAIERVVSAAIAETRSLAHNLRPPHIEQIGLTDSLQGLIREVSQSCAIRFERRLENVDDLFTGDAATHVFRIVQEALNNLVKHSRANEASITLERDVRSVRLRVADDGVGFDQHAIGSRHSLGLTSMTERARMLGGKLAIHSAPGEGTQLAAELPFTEAGAGQGAACSSS